MKTETITNEQALNAVAQVIANTKKDANLTINGNHRKELLKTKLKRLTPKQIAKMIKSGEWEKIENQDYLQFMCQTKPGVWTLDSSKRIQVRNKHKGGEIDEDHIDAAVSKQTKNRDLSLIDAPVAVYFLHATKFQGKVIPARSLMLIGGNHTTMILNRLGIFSGDLFVVSFEEDLQSSFAKLIGLGNKLNDPKKVEQPATNDDVKGQLYQIIEENVEKHGQENWKPTDEQQEELADEYDWISKGTISQWISNYEEFGSRSLKPLKTWTRPLLAQYVENLGMMSLYKDWHIEKPTTVTSIADSTIFGRLLYNMSTIDAKKGLITVYCTSLVMTKFVGDPVWRDKMQAKADKFCNWHNEGKPPELYIHIEVSYLDYE